MQLALFGMGNVSELGLRPEWTNEVVVTLFSSGTLDLTKRPPAPDARLTIVVLFGSANVVVPPDCRLTVGGISLVGARSVRAEPATGPDLRINLFAAFGGGDIRQATGKQVTGPGAVAEEQPFPF